MKLVGPVIVVGCAFMRPLEVWAVNAWDIGVPIRLLAVGAILSVLGLALYWLGRRIGMEILTASIASGGVVLVLMMWANLVGSPWLWLAAAVAVPWYLLADISPRITRLVVTLALGLVVVYPLMSLAAEHATTATTFAIDTLTPRSGATPTGDAEDIVLIVPDSYPAPVIAENWFHHDVSSLRTAFEAEGFEWEETGLSRHTFTLLALSSLFELQPVIDDSPTPAWGNLTSLYDIAGGDNYLRAALETAGFRYTHIESGFDGTKCGPEVDSCHRAGFFDESTWNLLVPSVFYGPLAARHGSYSVPGTIHATDEAVKVLEAIDGNGEHDFVFVHLLLPHPPVVVDQNCDVVPREDGLVVTGADSPFTAGYGPQLGCVDGYLERMARAAGDDAAVIVAADHGSGVGGQVNEPPVEWTDGDIAERFSILLTYRFPDACGAPVEPTNLDVMRAAVTCVADLEMPARETRYLIGALDPVWVDAGQMESIIGRLQAGDLPPPESG